MDETPFQISITNNNFQEVAIEQSLSPGHSSTHWIHSTLSCFGLYDLWTAWPVYFSHWLLPRFGTVVNLKGRVGSSLFYFPPATFCGVYGLLVMFSQLVLSLCGSQAVSSLHLPLPQGMSTLTARIIWSLALWALSGPKHSSINHSIMFASMV